MYNKSGISFKGLSSRDKKASWADFFLQRAERQWCRAEAGELKGSPTDTRLGGQVTLGLLSTSKASGALSGHKMPKRFIFV